MTNNPDCGIIITERNKNTTKEEKEMAKYYVAKYTRCGNWSEWKEVSKEKAEKKAKVWVEVEEGCWYQPYKIKVVEL